MVSESGDEGFIGPPQRARVNTSAAAFKTAGNRWTLIAERVNSESEKRRDIKGAIISRSAFQYYMDLSKSSVTDVVNQASRSGSRRALITFENVNDDHRWSATAVVRRRSDSEADPFPGATIAVESGTSDKLKRLYAQMTHYPYPLITITSRDSPAPSLLGSSSLSLAGHQPLSTPMSSRQTLTRVTRSDPTFTESTPITEDGLDGTDITPDVSTAEALGNDGSLVSGLSFNHESSLTVHDDFADLEALAIQADKSDGRTRLWPIAFTISSSASAENTPHDQIVFGSCNTVWTRLNQRAKVALGTVGKLKWQLEARGSWSTLESGIQMEVKQWKCVEFLNFRKKEGRCTPEDLVKELGDPALKRFSSGPRKWVCYRYGQVGGDSEAVELDRFAVGTERILRETKIPPSAICDTVFAIGTQRDFHSDDVQRTMWRVLRVV